MSKKEELQKLKEEVENCTRCELHLSRTQAVFGMGNPETKILFVGEAPGYYEDLQGLPFVGQAGKLLDRLLKEIGFSRQDIYIANVLKCRPPKNRDPLPQEIEICKPYLLKQIEIIQPSLVCTLGRFALHLLYGRKIIPISKFHGKVLTGDLFTIYPLFHPAAALHQPALYAPLREDFLNLAKVLSELKKASPIEKKPTQITLF
ncbi:MAG: uracil-DNA glycosylase [Caldiserica bacterium]|nr:uracil-DNA glycosylase [Caldisericota bacterium]